MQLERHIAKKTTLIFFIFCNHFLYTQNPFIQNKGQLPAHVITKTNLPSGSLFIEKGKCTYAFYDGTELAGRHSQYTPRESVSVVRAHAYTTTFKNSNQNAEILLFDESRHYENYFIGEKKNWASEVRSYKKHLQKNIYEGIDLVFFIYEGNLKLEFYVAPNSNTKDIKIEYKGLENMLISKEGHLVCSTSVNTILETKPYAYQIVNSEKKEIPCNYKLKNRNLSFVFPEGYDKNSELIIDPILEFSTYSGSTSDNFGYTATYDDLGFLYSGSTVFGAGYPTTLGAYDINYNNDLGGTDIVITKYDTTGTQRIYSTYLGGRKDELPHSMIVNSEKELFLFGTTGSSDFPITPNASQKTFKGGPSFTPTGIGVSFPSGSDIFVSKISKEGTNLLASTFIGGTNNDGLNTATELKYNYADEVRGEIDIDKNNNVFIATSTNSTDFPIKNGFQSILKGSQEGCIIKLDNQLSSIIWSSYLGGLKEDAIYSLALDGLNNIYVTGGTNSADFPTTTGAYLTTIQGINKSDAFVSKIDSDGKNIISSSYYGSSEYDQSYFVEIGSNYNVYLLGQTKANGTRLVLNSTYFQSNGGQFVAVFSKDLTNVLRSTVFGTGKGEPDISPTAFLVDVCNKIYIAGWGSNLGGALSTLNLSVSIDAFQSSTDGNDFYFLVLDNTLSSMLYGTYFGGSQSNEHVDGGTSRFDKRGVIYQSVCAGCGGNSDFPIEPAGAVSSTNNSLNCNNGVFKFNFEFPMLIAEFTAPFVTCDPTISFQNLTSHSLQTQYKWFFGEEDTSLLRNPTHTFLEAGLHKITLIASDPTSCNVSDTITKNIYILSNKQDTLDDIFKCSDENVQIGMPPLSGINVDYSWFPNYNLTSSILSNPFSSCTTSTKYTLIMSNGLCVDTLTQYVNVPVLNLNIEFDTVFCNTPILLTAQQTVDTNSFIWSQDNHFLDTLSLQSNYLAYGPGMFYVKSYENTCSMVDSIRVVMKNMDINLLASNICTGDSVVVRAENELSDIPLSYSWAPFTSETSFITDLPETSQWYKVTIEDTSECLFADSIFVSVYQRPTIDSLWAERYVVFKNEKTVLNIETIDSVYWQYNNSNSLSVEAVPLEDQCYQVLVFNEFNCVSNDSICIKVLDVFCNEDSIVIPTAFTPNQDRNLRNEQYFIIDKSGIITDFKIEIFNRLGQRVYFSLDINEKWDGTYKGYRLPPQVLDFYLEIRCVGDRHLFKKGNITLIR